MGPVGQLPVQRPIRDTPRNRAGRGFHSAVRKSENRNPLLASPPTSQIETDDSLFRTFPPASGLRTFRKFPAALPDAGTAPGGCRVSRPLASSPLTYCSARPSIPPLDPLASRESARTRTQTFARASSRRVGSDGDASDGGRGCFSSRAAGCGEVLLSLRCSVASSPRRRGAPGGVGDPSSAPRASCGAHPQSSRRAAGRALPEMPGAILFIVSAAVPGRAPRPMPARDGADCDRGHPSSRRLTFTPAGSSARSFPHHDSVLAAWPHAARLPDRDVRRLTTRETAGTCCRGAAPKPKGGDNPGGLTQEPVAAHPGRSLSPNPPIVVARDCGHLLRRAA